MKNIYLVLLFLTITFGCKAQQRTQLNDYTTEIIGTWISNDDLNYKREFTNNGICKDYSENVLVSTFSYSIGSSCENENTVDFIYLQLIDEDDDVYCFEINGINENDSNILSLTGLMRGKIQLYTKE